MRLTRTDRLGVWEDDEGRLYVQHGDKFVSGTDLCKCPVEPGAPYPACPHDIRGPEGTPGPTGSQAA